MSITTAIKDYVLNNLAFKEASGYTVTDDDEGWSRLSGDTKRDLSPLTQGKMQKMALYLWESNLLANRIVELPLAYLLADGVKLVADDESVQDILDAFWTDPINAMDIKLIKKARELSLFGEQCWPVFTNEYSGQVRMGYLDPSDIETVVTDPDNGEQVIGIVTKKDKKGFARRYRVIVNGPEEELFTQRTQAIRETFDFGECFYFCINDLSNGKRGRSDLLPQIDWLDAYDQFLFGEIERADFMRAFIYDVTLKNATPDEVKERARTIAPPTPGSVRVHNDSETWDAVTPDLKSQDAAVGARLIRNHIMGGATMPEHWFGGGGDVNRATGESMGEPTFKIFTMRQTYLGYILETLGKYVIRQSEIRQGGKEPDLNDGLYAFQVQWPEMITKDIAKYSAALGQVVMAVVAAISNDLLTKERGVQLIEKIAAGLGVEFNASEELEAVLNELADAAKNDVYTETDTDTEDGTEDSTDNTDTTTPPDNSTATADNEMQ